MIALFEVARADDESFIARRRRDRPAGVLLRALRDDVRFRFAEVGEDGGCEVVHEDGDTDGRGGVLLVDAFEVPAGEDDRFLADWRRTREELAAHRGYLGTRLHRSAEPADFRYVGIARWSSPLAYARALRQADLRPSAFPSHPALYQVVGGAARRAAQ